MFVVNSSAHPGGLLWDLFTAHATADAAHPAVHDGGRDYSFGEVLQRVEQFGGWLQKSGVGPGERVAIVLPNSVEYVICFLGALRVGAVAVGLNAAANADQIAQIVADVRPTVAVFHPSTTRQIEGALTQLNRQGSRLPLYVVYTGAPSAVADLADPRIIPFAFASADDCLTRLSPSRDVLAQIIYTTGATGRLQGVMLTHANIAANCRAILATLDLHRDDRTLAISPFSEAFGNSILFTHLAAGATLIINSTATLATQIQAQHVTGCAGGLEMYLELLADTRRRPQKGSLLQYVVCDAAQLTQAQVESIHTTFPFADLFLAYGRAEATAWLTARTPEDHDPKPASVGQALEGIELEIVTASGQAALPGETGDIMARGECIMQGYWNDVQASRSVLTPRGLHTGDHGSLDDEGYLTLADRPINANDASSGGCDQVQESEPTSPCSD